MSDLSEIRDTIAMLPTLMNRMEGLQNSVCKAEMAVSSMLLQYEREKRDVERIQKESFSTFLLKMVGKYEDIVEKEQREEIDAKLAYDREVTHLATLKADMETLALRIDELRQLSRTYENELERLRCQLEGRLSEPEGQQYRLLQDKRKSYISQMMEVGEALSAARNVKATAMRARESLGKADGWATFDMLASGGVISHLAKYSHVDDAEACFHKLDSQIRTLKTELSDISGVTVVGLGEISGTERVVNFWFDNIFTDWSVHGQIRGNAETISKLLNSIGSVESKLTTRQRECQGLMAENKRKQEDLLLSLNLQ